MTWPAQGFLFDQAEKQGISYFNYGEAVAGVVPLNPDKDRTPDDAAKVNRKFAKSDLGRRARRLLPERRVSGGVNLLTQQEVYDSSPPTGVLPPARVALRLLPGQASPRSSRTGTVPTFNYMVLPTTTRRAPTPGRAHAARDDRRERLRRSARSST